MSRDLNKMSKKIYHRALEYLKFLTKKKLNPYDLGRVYHAGGDVLTHFGENQEVLPLKIFCAMTLSSGPKRGFTDIKKIFRSLAAEGIITPEVRTITITAIKELRMLKRSLTPRCKHPGCCNNTKPHYDYCGNCGWEYHQNCHCETCQILNGVIPNPAWG